MHFQPYVQVGLFQKLMVLAFLYLLLIGENNGTANVLAEEQPLGAQEMQQQQQQQRQRQLRLHHPFDVFFSNKRRVPNSSDPLHNR
uniref:Uncharacterized protein n=1 Tax=Nelumbo nucifera TaxID=4432 RepID=A0A822Z9Z1_NELNU|nr:TPA_asm: hypothetical protein HUJ06_015713 [Nelumbo nucifera]